MPPHLSITCPEDNNYFIILQGSQINLVRDKLHCSLYHLASEMVPKGQSRQAGPADSSSIHSPPGCPVSRLWCPGTLRPSPHSYGKWCWRTPVSPLGEQHWAQATSQSLAASKHGSGVSTDLGPHRRLGRVQAALEGQRLSLSASWLQGQNKMHTWVLVVSTRSCFSTALQYNMVQSSTCPGEIISPYYCYSGERNEVGRCKATGQGIKLVSILMHNIMTRQQQQCKTLNNSTFD